MSLLLQHNFEVTVDFNPCQLCYILNPPRGLLKRASSGHTSLWSTSDWKWAERGPGRKAWGQRSESCRRSPCCTPSLWVPPPALMVNRQLKESPTAPLDSVQPYSLNNPRCEPEISQRPEMQDLMHRPPWGVTSAFLSGLQMPTIPALLTPGKLTLNRQGTSVISFSSFSLKSFRMFRWECPR